MFEFEKRFRSSLLACFLISGPAFAESEYAEHHREASADGSVELTIGFASTNVFRGEDEFASRFEQKSSSYRSFNNAPAFKPALVWHTPVAGLYFEIEPELAIRGRKDRDTDGRMQFSPGGANVWMDSYAQTYVSGSTVPVSTSTANSTVLSEIQAGGWPTNSIASMEVYKPYKEQNGLNRRDEIEFKAGYDTSHWLGDFGFGLLVINGVGPKGKENPFDPSASDEAYRHSEIFFRYAPPFLRSLSLTSYADMVNSNQYHQLSYATDWDITSDFEITFEGGPAYAVNSGIQGWHDVTGRLGVQYAGLSAGVNAACRPKRAFFTDAENTTRPLEWDGSDRASQGLITDPSQNNGLFNDARNAFITQAVRRATGNQFYTYTPRQKIPRWIYWVDASYTVEF